MGKFIYRMCLAVFLMAAVVGGIYYYMTFYQEEEQMEKGTFVRKTDGSCSRDQTILAADREGPAARGFAQYAEEKTKDEAEHMFKNLTKAVQEIEHTGEKVKQDMHGAVQAGRQAARDIKNAAEKTVQEIAGAERE